MKNKIYIEIDSYYITNINELKFLILFYNKVEPNFCNRLIKEKHEK